VLLEGLILWPFQSKTGEVETVVALGLLLPAQAPQVPPPVFPLQASLLGTSLFCQILLPGSLSSHCSQDNVDGRFPSGQHTTKSAGVSLNTILPHSDRSLSRDCVNRAPIPTDTGKSWVEREREYLGVDPSSTT
jgi:hypothetical protein